MLFSIDSMSVFFVAISSLIFNSVTHFFNNSSSGEAIDIDAFPGSNLPLGHSPCLLTSSPVDESLPKSDSEGVRALGTSPETYVLDAAMLQGPTQATGLYTTTLANFSTA